MGGVMGIGGSVGASEGCGTSSESAAAGSDEGLDLAKAPTTTAGWLGADPGFGITLAAAANGRTTDVEADDEEQ